MSEQNTNQHLARRGNFILLKDDCVDDEFKFIVYQSTPIEWEEGRANYGERFEGVGQAVLNLLARSRRGY